MTAPMAADLEENGYEGLKTPEQVTEALQRPGTTLLVVNSVCGCAAGMARPAAKAARRLDKVPDNFVTVFAGVDTEATAKAREHLLPYPPSSPCMVLLKDGKIVHFIERHHIEGRSAEQIYKNLESAFNMYC